MEEKSGTFRERQKPKDRFYWKLYDKDGNLKDEGGPFDLILTDGREIFADRIIAGTQNYLQCQALGTSNQAPAVSDTDLIGTELGYKASTNSQPSSGLARFETTWLAGEGTGTIEEAVLADTVAAKGARKCAVRVLTGTIVKASGDILTTIFEIDFPA